MKILIFICIILLFANMYLIYENISLNSRLESNKEENEALMVYLNNLQDKIKQFESNSNQRFDIPKTIKIRELLENYLRDYNNQQYHPDLSVSTEELRNDLHDYQLKQRFIPNVIPIVDRFEISQYFSDNHKGIDLAAPLGTEVVATAAGVIKSVYEDKYFGNVVIIDHLNHYISFYAHLAKTFFEPGIFVEKRQTIGLVGSSGFSPAPHLHFEIIYRGDNTDPMNLANYIDYNTKE